MESKQVSAMKKHSNKHRVGISYRTTSLFHNSNVMKKWEKGKEGICFRLKVNEELQQPKAMYRS